MNGEPAVLQMALGPDIPAFRAALAAAGASLALAGCASDVFTPPPIDETSAVADQVRQAGARSGPAPRFADIPRTPLDVRPVGAWNRNVFDTLRLRRELAAQAVVTPMVLGDTDKWAAETRALAQPPAPPGPPPAPDAAGGFARDARDRATPPSQGR